LALVLESGLAGPSLVAKEVGVGISTAYRDLAFLEEAGLIVADGGKRTLTPEGLSYLGDLMNRS
jgi:DNA-binding IclR family transcriptional regulator